MSSGPLLFEHLPNEILGKILSYLNGVHAFISFSALNNRFRSLVCQHCTAVDFKWINKAEFDGFFQQNNTQQWKSLRLVDDDDTAGQIEYFARRYASLKCFSQLKSLSLWNTTLLNCRSLTELSPILENLVTLTIGPMDYAAFPQLKLPKLKQLVIREETAYIPEFQHLPELESVECQIGGGSWALNNFQWPSTLKRLKILFRFCDDLIWLSNSLRHLSRLETLELYQSRLEHRSMADGRIWEELIASSLPLLKNFRFYFQVLNSDTSGNEIQQMIASFSTPFYVIEKNLFIRCDVKKRKRGSCAVLYSIPLGLDRLTVVAKHFSESFTTLPNDRSKNRYRNIYANATALTFHNAPAYDRNFDRTRVTSLKISCYIDFTEWTHTLTNLSSLQIKFDVRIWSKNFAHLLSNSPNLRSLTIEKNLLRGVTKNYTDPHICHLLSIQIRSLKLCFRRSVLSQAEVPRIVSIFAANCRHLSISFLINTKTAGYILKHMGNLQNLYLRFDPESKSLSDTLYAEFKRQKLAFTSLNMTITKSTRHEHRLRKHSQFESYLMAHEKSETPCANHRPFIRNK